jgi:hypothetical protein
MGSPPVTGYDPTLDYARPDVEALVHAVVQPYGGVVSWATTAEDRDLPGWLAAVTVQVDVKAGRKAECFRKADLIRRAVCALPWADWPDGVVARVDTTEGPFWLPDSDGAPRYVARYVVVVHPRPADQKGRTA